MRVVPKFLLPFLLLGTFSVNLNIIDTLAKERSTKGLSELNSESSKVLLIGLKPSDRPISLQTEDTQATTEDVSSQSGGSDSNTTATSEQASDSGSQQEVSTEGQSNSNSTGSSEQTSDSGSGQGVEGETGNSNSSQQSEVSSNETSSSETGSSSNETGSTSNETSSTSNETSSSSNETSSTSNETSSSSNETGSTSNETQSNSTSSNETGAGTPDPPVEEPIRFGLKFMNVSSESLRVGSEFEVIVGIFNLNSDILDSNNSQNNVTLALSSGNLTGASQVQVKNGVAEFTHLSIDTIGNYSLIASSESLDPITYDREIIVEKWPLAFLSPSSATFFTSYFEFEIIVSLSTEKSSYIDEETVTIEANLTLIGETSVKSSNGQAVFHLYTPDIGEGYFLITCLSVSAGFTKTVQSPQTIISVDSELTQTSNWFNLTLDVFDYEGLNKLSLTNVSFTVSVGADSLYGNPSVVAVDGHAVLNDLVIIDQGSYQFTAVGKDESGKEVTRGVTQVYEISVDQSNLPVGFHELKNMTIGYSTREPTAFFSFKVNVFLYNQIGKSYDKVCEAGVVGNNTLYGSTYHETRSGQSNFEVFTKNPGTLSLLITVCDTFSRSDEIVVFPMKGKIEVEDHINDNSNYFNVKVGIYDNSLTLLEDKNGIYNISINLSPEGDLSGSMNYPQVKGEWTFQRVSILEQGNFFFQASIKESESNSRVLFLTSPESYQITSENAKVPDDLLVISEIEAEYYEIVSTFEAFQINVTIEDQEENLWNQECNVVINSNMTIYGETSKIAYDGTVKFNVYFKEVGYAKVTVLTCDGLTVSFEMQVLPYTQKVSITPHIEQDSNYFDILVEIFDSFGESLLDTHGKFNISIFLLPEGKLTSNSKGLAVKGFKEFSPVTILTPGDYQFGVAIHEKSGLTPKEDPLIYNETFQITAENAFIPKSMLHLSYLEVEINSSVLTVFFPFQVKIKLFDQVNTTWEPNCLVNLTSDDEIFGEVSKEAVSGEVEFEIYFIKKGDIKLTIITETGYEHEVQLSLKRQKLQLEPILKKFPESHYFNVTVDVLDNTLQSIESENGNYSVSLFTTPKSVIHGNLTQICEAGVCSFTGLSILTPGDYKFGATVIELTSGKSTAGESYSEGNFKITEQRAHIFLHQIQLFLDEKPTEHVCSNLTVLLLDINHDLYNETMTVTVNSGDDYHGAKKLEVIDGNSSLKFFFTSIGNQSINVSTDYKSRVIKFKVEERMNYPLLLLIIVFWMMVILLVIFYVNDKEKIDDESGSFGLRMYCPVMILADSGDNNLRIVTTLRVFASQFMMFTLIGIFYNKEILDAPQAEDGFEAYGLEDWYQGFLVLLIAQCFSCPFAFCHYFNLKSKAVSKIIIGISLMIIICSAIFAVWSLTEYSSKYYLFWVLNFSIYGLIELFLVHSLYGIFFFCCFFKPEVTVEQISSPKNDLKKPFIAFDSKRNSVGNDDEKPRARAPRVSVLLRK